MVDENPNNEAGPEKAPKARRWRPLKSKKVEEPVADAPAAEPAAAEIPAAEVPAAAAPAAPEPNAEAATAPAAEKSTAAKKPRAEKPPVDQPVAEESTLTEPAVGASTPRKRPAKKASGTGSAATKSGGAAKDSADQAARPAVAPTTALLFQAPDLPPMPERPAAAEEPTAETSRRRSRRRSSDAPRDGDDAPGTTVRVRQPRPKEEITEPQRVKGSTRLEAKKQRRRDGRDAGRRRPVVTEAEFLARRESVDRVMVVRSKYGRIQIGVLEDGVLVEHYVARAQDASLIGNVYLGRVQNVLPSMEAAFVDIGRGRNAVLYSGEVDWEAAAAASAAEGEPAPKNQARRIELALKPGDRVLVQVTKDPVGHKGARLTSQVSLPGRFLVYVPGGSMNGISRKLPDTERARLKKILKEVLPDDAGVIVRTAAEGATEEQLTLDVQRLTAQWAHIAKTVESGNAPQLLHSEPDLLIKIVRDVFNEDFQKLVVEGDDAMETISAYLGAVAPDLMGRLERYTGEVDSFDHYRIAEQIEKALERKVWLPSGGSLVMDRTEAMTVIDVNTGKFVGSGGNLEETVTKNNLEAAEEIVRQLRLRDIGGIIVVDFIDMVLESNRDLVLRRMIECLSRDRTKHQVAEVTSLGLVQMTRKKLGLGLVESFSEACDTCAGRGIVVHHEPVFKHRGGGNDSSSQGGSNSGGSSRRRGGRGGSGNSGGNAAPKQSSGSSGTHALTEDVRNAIAQVAKSTVAHEHDHEHETKAASGESTAAPSITKIEQAAEAAANAAVKVLDLPIEKSQRSGRRMDPHAAEEILGSVLEALPEPPAPGAGRARRSRRATSKGEVVTPKDGPAN
tara:strand:+ start:15394 stop:17931 length:2538 start_codon:yes stop_codon:yes gene_type:complete